MVKFPDSVPELNSGEADSKESKEQITNSKVDVDPAGHSKEEEPDERNNC